MYTVIQADVIKVELTLDVQGSHRASLRFRQRQLGLRELGKAGGWGWGWEGMWKYKMIE